MSSSTDTTSALQDNFNPDYETSRVADESTFLKKMRIKRLLFRFFGEIYIGRRVKFAYFWRWMSRLNVASMQQVMEVGSGDGVFCFALAKACPHVHIVGLELNRVEARVCETLAKQEKVTNLHFEEGVLCSDKWKDQFDLIYSLDVLEHVQEDLALMREIYGALAEGGSLLIHVPHRNFQETDGRMISVADEEAWRINPGHVRQGYSPDDMSAKLVSVGFKVKATQMTQSHAITYAFRLYERVERFLPIRIAILPVIDYLIRQDTRRTPEHGNTVWFWAQKPDVGDSNKKA